MSKSISDEKTYEERKKEIKTKWFERNAHKATSGIAFIIPLVPDLGSCVNVNDINIPEDIFPDEYKTIVEAYFSVLNKLKNKELKIDK